jgi:hypothetical protein
VPWTHLTDPQPYPTPASIDPTKLGTETLGEPYLGQHSSWSLDEPQTTTDDLAQHAPPVFPDLASGGDLEGIPNEEKLPREIYEMKTPSAVSLNPLAIPFVPLGYNAGPTDDTPVIPPILDPEISPSPVESEICQSPAVGVPSTVAIHNLNEEPETPACSEEATEASKVASHNDIDAWGAVPGSGSSWDDASADPWAIPHTGVGWDAGPDEDAFRTPPRTAISPTAAQEHREPVESKEKKATTSCRNRKSREPQSTSVAQKGKSRGKKHTKSASFSPRQYERRQSTPSVVPSKKSGKCRSLVTVHSEPAVASSEPWTEGPPQTQEMEDEELAKSYEIKPLLGSIIPSKKMIAEITKAHLQLAREKPPYFENIPVTEETAEVDPGINWVNGGPSRLTGKADPPRKFSERSRPAGSTWGVKQKA